MRNEEMLYTVKDVSIIIRTSPDYVYALIRKGLLPALKLGSLKVRRQALIKFLEENEGCDLSNLDDITMLDTAVNVTGTVLA